MNCPTPPKVGDTAPIHPNDIKVIVADAFGVGVSDINGRCRRQPIAIARQTCYYYLRKHWGDTYHHIGKKFFRDHAAIMWGVKQVDNQRETNPEVSRVLDTIEEFYPALSKRVIGRFGIAA